MTDHPDLTAEQSDRVMASIALAREINARLDELGITPLMEAHVTLNGELVPSLLVDREPANELHGVHATWDEEHGKVQLLIAHYDVWAHGTDLKPSRYLDTPKDVERARLDGRHDMPAWLVAAEEAREDRELEARGFRILAAKEKAQKVNDRLAYLGITPLQGATVSAHGYLVPAKLTEKYIEAYAVHAGWDDRDNEVRLYVGDWEDTFPGLLPSRILRGIDDVAYARHEGPSSRPDTTPRLDLRAIALRGVNTRAGNYSEDTAAIVAALGSLTAAVLHTADVITNRP